MTSLIFFFSLEMNVQVTGDFLSIANRLLTTFLCVMSVFILPLLAFDYTLMEYLKQ